MFLGFLPLFLLPIIYASNSQQQNDIQVVYQWKQLSYGFPNAAERERALANGNLIPANSIPIDVLPQYHHNEKVRVFITIPRFQTGIPYSLATVTERQDANGPILQAYPNYEWHNSHGRNCDQITSAFRTATTECGQLWVIDSGMIGSTQYCQPQLLVFDLQKNQLVHRYRFNTNVYVPSASLLVTPLIIVQDPPPRGRCQQVMVYIADVTHHGLIVYDSKQNIAWRVENKYMYPDPDYGTHTITGESFTLMDGIFGMSSDKRNLYFHPLASISEYSVPLSVLNNYTNWVHGPEAMGQTFRVLGARNSECAAEVMDSRNNLYCVTFNPIKLISWNVNTPYGGQHLCEVAANVQLLEFVSGIKTVMGVSGKEELWMMSNRFQKFSAGTLNESEVNFRVLKREINDLQNDGGCTKSPSHDLSNKLIFT